MKPRNAHHRGKSRFFNGLLTLSIALTVLACDRQDAQETDSPSIKPFSSLPAATPDRNPGAWHNRALVCLRRGDLAGAAKAGETALRLNPRHRPARELLVDLYMSQGEYDRVVTLLERLVQSGLDEAGLYEALGNAYAAMARLDAAEEAFVAAIERDSLDVRTYNNLAFVYTRGRNAGKAIQILEKVRKLDPTYVVGLYNLGLAYVENGEYGKATAILQQVAELDSAHAGARYSLGLIHLETGKYAEAARVLEAALDIDPTFAAAHYRLGTAYLEQGEDEQAIRHLTRAIDLDPTFVDAHYRLGQLFIRHGQREEAERAFAQFQRWRETTRTDPDLWRQIDHHKQTLTSNPRDARTHYALGRLYAEQGWLAEAEGEFRLAIEVDPGYRPAWQQLGPLYLKTERVREAIAVFEELVRQWPRDVAAWNDLCIAYTTEDQLDEALWAFQRALAIAPDSPHLHFNLGHLYRKRGETQEALTAYKKALARDPGNERIREEIARLANQ